MQTSRSSITGLLDHLETVSRQPSAKASVARWARSVDGLLGHETPSDLAARCHAAHYSERDLLLKGLVCVAHSDELAQLTVVAAVADRLQWVVAGWRRRGAPLSDLVVMEGDVVAECWAAVARIADRVHSGGDCPARLCQWLVDQAREPVRVPRRKELRASARQVPLDELRHGTVDFDPRPATDRLAVELARSVREGRISVTAVRPVFLTRVIGFDVAETARRLGCTPAVVRAIRSRSERQLVA